MKGQGEVNDDGVKFSVVYTSYGNALYGFALKYTRSKEDAEDITQEVLLRLWEQWHRISQVDDLKAYLFRMVLNASHNYSKKQARYRRIQNLFQHRYSDYYLDHTLESKECNKIYRAAVNRLPERQQQVIILRQWGFSTGEMACKLNISRNTIDNHLARARKIVKGYVCGYLNFQKEEEYNTENKCKPAIAA